MEIEMYNVRYVYSIGPHTGANLSQKFLETLQEFGIAMKVNLQLFIYNLYFLSYY